MAICNSCGMEAGCPCGWGGSVCRACALKNSTPLPVQQTQQPTPDQQRVGIQIQSITYNHNYGT